MSIRRAPLLTLITGLAVAALFTVTVWLHWSQIRFWWLFEPLRTNAQGYPEYRHRPTGAVFVKFASKDGFRRVFLSFAGEDDFVEVPDDASLRFREGASAACWLFLEEAREGTVLNRWHVGREDLILRIRPDGRGEFNLYFDGQVNVAVTTSAPVPTQRWVHLAGTYDGTKMRFYRNGRIEEERAESRGILHAACSLRIGAVHRDNTVWPSLKGRVSQVALFNRGLSSDEIQWLQFGLAPSSEEGLAAYYDRGEEELVPDRSGHGNHGHVAPPREVQRPSSTP